MNKKKRYDLKDFGCSNTKKYMLSNCVQNVFSVDDNEKHEHIIITSSYLQTLCDNNLIRIQNAE